MKNELYLEEITAYVEELKREKLFMELPSHAFLLHKPIVGDFYEEAAKKVFFIGQDSNHIGGKLENDSEKSRIEYIKTQHWAETFDFKDDKDNFLNWRQKYNYLFWAFPIRFMNLLLNGKNEEISTNEIASNPNYAKQFKSFGWANLSPIVYRNVYIKQAFENKINAGTYRKFFGITQKHFGTFSFINKYYKPEIIVILSAKFDENVFFSGVKYERKVIDEKNGIIKYIVNENNKKTNVFSTYHPSGMNRKHNADNKLFTLERFVDVIFKNI